MENADKSGRKLRFNRCWKAVECLTDNGRSEVCKDGVLINCNDARCLRGHR